MIKSGVVASVALWDGVAEWDPVKAGQCDSTADVTGRPDVGPGWSVASGAFTAPAEVATPDPAGFIRDIVTDRSLAVATRNALGPWLFGLGAALQAGDVALISEEWGDLVAGLPVSAGDRIAIVGHAQGHHIPGIT